MHDRKTSLTTITVMFLVAAAATLGGCSRTVVAHLRNDTEGTIGILRHDAGHTWCWTPQSSGLDTFRLPPHGYIRIAVGSGESPDDAIRSIACDTIAIVSSGRLRLVTREEIEELEILKVGSSTYFFLLK